MAKHFEKQFKEKESKEHKEKDHKEKEHIKDVKDLKDKDHKEHKEAAKETETQPVQPFVQDPFTAASLTPTLKVQPDKLPEKFFEKVHPDKVHFEKLFKDVEKLFKDKDKDIFEGGIFQNQGDPALLQRIAALESAVGQLMHFIPAEMRPDLSTGALSQEPEAKKSDNPQSPEAPSDKGKK